MCSLEKNDYMTSTRSATQACGVPLPQVHGVDKIVDPNVKPEKKQGVISSNKSM